MRIRALCSEKGGKRSRGQGWASAHALAHVRRLKHWLAGRLSLTGWA